MLIRKSTLILCLFFGLWIFNVNAQDKVSFSQYDANDIVSWVSTNGHFVSHIPTQNAGLEWPKGSLKTAVFASGLWIVGKVGDDIRSAAAEYRSEFVAGPYGRDPSSPRNKIFRVSPDFPEGLDINGDGDFDDTYHNLRNAGFSSPTGEFDPWSAWPVENGAPVDANGDPEIMGDGMVWMVFNDGDTTAHDTLWGTAPLGVEVQTNLFGFTEPPELRSVMFLRWVIENKGGNVIDSTFVLIWTDADVGRAGDDLMGVDVGKNMAYYYNGFTIDGVYGSTPPAVGYDFVQGPIVPSSGDTAFVSGEEIPDFKNLPIYAVIKFISAGPPEFEDPGSAEEAFNIAKGLKNLGHPLINPLTGRSTRINHAGDPVIHQGWLDTNPGDRRFLMSTGPFTFAPGDKQEIVAAVILARGMNNIDAITTLRFIDVFAQTAFNHQFELPQPVVPDVAVTELDREVLLTWNENDQAVETFRDGGYGFEGYNIYQGASINGPWTRLATFDLDNEITFVNEKVLNEETGLVDEHPAAFGANSGIQRFFTIKTDALNDSLPVINYRKYYFAVTSYLVNPGGFPRVIESAIIGNEAIPHEPDFGDVLNGESGQVLPVEHTSGFSDAEVTPIIIDPERLTGHRYRVTFDENGTWDLFDINRNTTVLSEQSDLGGLSNEIVDGLLVIVDGSFELPRTYETAEFVVDADTSDPGLDLWFDGTAFGPTGDVAAVSGQFPRAAIEFLQLDIELRFTGIPSDQSSLAASIDSPIITGGHWGTYYEQSVATGARSLPADLSDRQWNPVRLPFELWDIENDRQVNCIVLNRNADGAAPYGATAGDPSTPGMEPRYRISGRDYIIPMMTDYDEEVGMNDRLGWDGVNREFPQHRPNSDFTTWFLFFHQNGDDTWTTGDIYRLTYDNPILPGVDEFEFDTPANVRDDRELALSQIDKINVFPNPYMGFNLEAPDLSRRFVRFTHLEGRATIRIFTISGRIVRVLAHDGSSQFCEWDLTNEQGRLVASGVYLVQVDLHTLGAEKLLKLAVFQPRQ